MEFAYDNYGNTIASIANTSDGRQLVEQTLYNVHPDYVQPVATSPDAINLKRLFTQYQIKNYPVEQLTYTSEAPSGGTTPLGTERITKGTLFFYNPEKPVLSKIMALELQAPLNAVTYNPQPTYNFIQSKIQNGNFVYDSKYRLQQTVNSNTAYPPGITTQPLSITSRNTNEAYTWDHYGQYMTSRTKNALAAEIACTSFEGTYLASGSNDDNRGNWDFDRNRIVSTGYTGNKALDLSVGSIMSINTMAPGKKFIVSFWAKGTGVPRIKLGNTLLPQTYAPAKTAGAWKLYRITVTGTGEQLSVLASSSGPQLSMDLDEIRLYPENALMSSYTYNAVTGNVTSISDEADNIAFYTYDGLGRLILVRDENGNILKKHTYQLQGLQ